MNRLKHHENPYYCQALLRTHERFKKLSEQLNFVDALKTESDYYKHQFYTQRLTEAHAKRSLEALTELNTPEITQTTIYGNDILALMQANGSQDIGAITTILDALKADDKSERTPYSLSAFQGYFQTRSADIYQRSEGMHRLISLTPFLAQHLGEDNTAALRQSERSSLTLALSITQINTTYRAHYNRHRNLNNLTDDDKRWIASYANTLNQNQVSVDVCDPSTLENLKKVLIYDNELRFKTSIPTLDQLFTLVKLNVINGPGIAFIQDLVNTVFNDPNTRGDHAAQLVSIKALTATLRSATLDEMAADALLDYIGGVVKTPNIKPRMIAAFLAEIASIKSLKSSPKYLNIFLLWLKFDPQGITLNDDYFNKTASESDRTMIRKLVNDLSLSNSYEVSILLNANSAHINQLKLFDQQASKAAVLIETLITDADGKIFPGNFKGILSNCIRCLPLRVISTLSYYDLKNVTLEKYIDAILASTPQPTLETSVALFERYMNILAPDMRHTTSNIKYFKTHLDAIAKHYDFSVPEIYLLIKITAVKSLIPVNFYIEQLREGGLSLAQIRDHLTPHHLSSLAHHFEFSPLFHPVNETELALFLSTEPTNSTTLRLIDYQTLGIDFDTKNEAWGDHNTPRALLKMRQEPNLPDTTINLIFRSRAIQHALASGSPFESTGNTEQFLKLLLFTASGMKDDIYQVAASEAHNLTSYEEAFIFWMIQQTAPSNWVNPQTLHLSKDLTKCVTTIQSDLTLTRGNDRITGKLLDCFNETSGGERTESLTFNHIRSLYQRLLDKRENLRIALRDRTLLANDRCMLIALLISRTSGSALTPEAQHVHEQMKCTQPSQHALDALKSQCLDHPEPNPRSAMIVLALQQDISNEDILMLINGHLNIKYTPEDDSNMTVKPDQAQHWTAKDTIATLSILSKASIATLKIRLTHCVLNSPELKQHFLALNNESDKVINRNIVMHIIRSGKTTYQPKSPGSYRTFLSSLRANQEQKPNEPVERTGNFFTRLIDDGRKSAAVNKIEAQKKTYHPL